MSEASGEANVGQAEVIGVVGYGRFGAALCDLATQAGIPWLAHDPVAPVPAAHAAASPAALAARARFVVLCTPVHAFEAALAELRPWLTPAHIVMDVGSVKLRPDALMRERLGAEVPWVATHPLFGPVSLGRGERPLRVIVCDNTLHPQAVDAAAALYRQLGCEVRRESADEHDRAMARTHALVFFVAKGLLQLGEPPPVDYAPASYQAIARAVEAVRADAGHLFVTIQNDNPHSGATRRALLEALADIEERLELRGPDRSPDPAVDPLAIPTPTVVAPELQRAREEIDRLDTELLALLARRARLSRRAARSKAAHGRPVRDPAREAALLDARAEAAVALGLPEGAIRDVFAAILRQSRTLQRDEPSG